MLALAERMRRAGQKPEDERTPLDDLSPQEYMFVRRFVGSADLYRSAIEAGYSESQALTMKIVMDRPHVRRAIDHIRSSQDEHGHQVQKNVPLQQIQMLEEILATMDLPWEAKVAVMREIRAVAQSISFGGAEKGTREKALDTTRATRVKEEIIKAIRTGLDIGDVFDAVAPSSKKDRA